ncbi:cyclase family protein [Desulfoscipio geothermicus]|uniref:Kynurenine formamidase n=1 Tax=Desulfoscipio geothermicus DSM 3669 TaxID=1121426 RepID=A0A1I6DIM0_9FIRM|nr:cyclase family protein [Desulfoscipio geothermicus]SFR05231.1 Kynurenine formamidase [Desulfoscipio geothermicus DSM 3669]
MFKIEKIVDLSFALTNDTQVYPGDPKPDISVATTIENDGYNLHYVNLGSQTGTHVDAPYHFLNEGATIDNINLKSFMGEGVIVRVTDKQANKEITVEDIKPYENFFSPGKIVVFNTNWYKKNGSDAYYEHPYLSVEACEYLLGKGIKTMGIDAINLDPTGGDDFPVHDMLAEANGIIVENLANVDKIDFDNPFLIFLPLKLIGCDGSPVRAVAVKLAGC